MMEAENADRGAAARRLVRGRDHAALATTLAGRPYVSLVASACAIDASPLLLLSDLAQHTRNLDADPLVSLLFEDTGGHPDPLAGPRLTLLGRAERCDDAHAAAAQIHGISLERRVASRNGDSRRKVHSFAKKTPLLRSGTGWLLCAHVHSRFCMKAGRPAL